VRKFIALYRSVADFRCIVHYLMFVVVNSCTSCMRNSVNWTKYT